MIATAARSIDTVVVGAGQAGLVMSRFLQEAGRDHVVLDRRSTLGGGWQDRWDGFRLVSPNWTVSLPGLDYGGPDPDAFMPRDEIVDHFRRYAAAIAAPVELETDVTALAALDGPAGRARFRVTTSRGTIDARSVIVAGGPFQRPHIPAAASSLPPGILSLHAHDYRRPEALPAGRVLLIGSGQTGVQLADELMQAGREVLISVGHCGRTPRRYRGRDVFWWLRQLGTRGREIGVMLPTVEKLPSPAARLACNPQLSGHDGGKEMNLRRMGLDGLRLLGRYQGVDGSRARFAPDLGENLRFADTFFAERLRPLFDAFIEAIGEQLPAHEEPPPVAYDPPEIAELDLAAEGVSTVLWTSGYRPAFGWIEPPVVDEFGLPRGIAGATDAAGLWFLGTPWLVDMGSANLIGIARDAEAIAARID